MSVKAERPLKDAIKATFVEVPRNGMASVGPRMARMEAAPKKLYERRRGGGPRGDEREGCDNARSSVEAEAVHDVRGGCESARSAEQEGEAIETPWRRSRRLRERPINPRTRRLSLTRGRGSIETRGLKLEVRTARLAIK